jgi:hypothetical protein
MRVKVFSESLHLCLLREPPHHQTTCPSQTRQENGAHSPFLERRGLGGGPVVRAVEFPKGLFPDVGRQVDVREKWRQRTWRKQDRMETPPMAVQGS